jgi:hypothetical protein
VIHLQYLLQAEKGHQTLPTKEIFSPISFPWGSFGHEVSELLSSTVKVPHGDLGYSWRSCSSVEIDSPVASWFGFLKAFILEEINMV